MDGQTLGIAGLGLAVLVNIGMAAYHFGRLSGKLDGLSRRFDDHLSRHNPGGRET